MSKTLIALMIRGCAVMSQAQTKAPLEERSWQRVSVPSTASFRGLSIPNAQCIWISGTGNTVLRSVDQGQNWKAFFVGPSDSKLDFRDIWALDDQTAWAMSAGPGQGSRIYVTRNGGTSWEPEHLNQVEGAFFDGLTFLNQDRGLVYSDPVDGMFLILERAEGAWRKLPMKLIPRALAGEASFAASGTGIFSIGKAVWFGSGGGAKARVFRSFDGGENWMASETPLRAGDPASGVFSVSFRDKQHGVIVGGKYDAPEDATGTAAVTSDGGESWQLAQKPPRGFRSCVVYVPGLEQALVCAGTTGIDLSKDDGRTWSAMSDLKVNVLKFSGSEGWAAGPDGLVARLSP